MLKAQYAVRGELYLKGEELRKAGRDILYTNGEKKERGKFFARAAPRSWGSALRIHTHASLTALSLSLVSPFPALSFL